MEDIDLFFSREITINLRALIEAFDNNTRLQEDLLAFLTSSPTVKV